MTSTAEEIARQFLVPDEPEDMSPIRAASVRMPASRLHLIDVLAEHAGVSRNVMANQLLSAGIDAVMSQLPPEIEDAIKSDLVERMEGE